MVTNAFLETPNAVRRRKILLAMLTPRIGSRASLDALILWETHFGSNESLLFGAVEYSRLLVQKFDIGCSALMFSNEMVTHLINPPFKLDDLHDPVGMCKNLYTKMQAQYQSNSDNLLS